MTNTQYFLLDRDKIFQRGDRNWAIYDLSSGDMISVNSRIGTVVGLAEKGRNVSEIAESTKIDSAQVIEVLEELVARKFGQFYMSRPYIEKDRVGGPYNVNLPYPPIIRNLYIELPGDCSRECSFCGYPTLFQCVTCSRSKGKQDISLLKRAISRILQADCLNVVLWGGDPLARLNEFVSIAEFCRGLGYSGGMSVITNGTLIDEDVSQVFAKYRIHPVIPVFLTKMSDDDPNEESLLSRIATLAHDQAVDFSVVAVLFEDSPSPSRLQRMVVQMRPTNVLRAGIYNDKSAVRSEKLPTLISTALRTTPGVYYHNKRHHPCLWGSIAVSVTGDILPCPHLRKEALGNIKDPNCIDVCFESRAITDYWDLALSKIDGCQDCSFRLGCADCRALETRLTGDLYGKRLCTFAHETGSAREAQP